MIERISATNVVRSVILRPVLLSVRKLTMSVIFEARSMKYVQLAKKVELPVKALCCLLLTSAEALITPLIFLTVLSIASCISLSILNCTLRLDSDVLHFATYATALSSFFLQLPNTDRQVDHLLLKLFSNISTKKVQNITTNYKYFLMRDFGRVSSI